jgi:Transposase, Mutator family
LKAIYRAKDAEAGQRALEEFATSAWGRKYEVIAASWRRNWTAVIPFFVFSDERLQYIQPPASADLPSGPAPPQSRSNEPMASGDTRCLTDWCGPRLTSYGSVAC